MEALIRATTQNRTAVLMLVFMIVVLGLGAYGSLPREAAPDLKIPIVLVTVPYPGVSPVDVETLVTREVEKDLAELKNVKVMRSTSAEGAAIISVEFDPDVDIDEAVRRAREKVQTARPRLPEDVLEPVVQEVSSEDFPILTVSIAGDYSIVRLKQIAEGLQDRIETVPGVLEVDLRGGVEREIQVLVDPDRLRHHGLSIGEVVQAVGAENVNMPGGAVEAGASSFLVRVPGEYGEPSEIADIVVKTKAPQGGAQVPIRVADVARVVDTYKERTTLARIDGTESVSLTITKRGGENLIRIADDVKRIVAETPFPPGTKTTFLQDASKLIKDMVRDLENNIISGLLLVIAVLPLFLTVRSSLIVASAIPLSFLVAFVTLQALGITLNMIVLFSLILALGMLVDNSIVLVENTYRLMSEGVRRWEAVVRGAAEIAGPVIMSTATTVAAFVPLLWWPGTMGKFMGFLPRTVIILLVASLFVALLVNPVMCGVFLKVNAKHRVDENDEPDSPLYRRYRRVLVWALDHRAATMGAVVALLVATIAVFASMRLGVEFFPESTPDNITVEARAADGTRLQATDEVMRRIEAVLERERNIENYVTTVGAGGGGGGMGAGGGAAPHLGQISIDFLEPEARVESTLVTIERIRGALDAIPGAKFEVRKQQMGPPAGAPVGVEIAGPDWTVLGRLTAEATALLQPIPNLVDLKDDFAAGRPEVQVRVDRERAKLVGTSTAQVAQAVRTAINGTKATVLRDGKDEYDVTVKLDDARRQSLTSIDSLVVTGRDGLQVPLREIATIVTTAGAGSIRHKDQVRVITLSANTEGRLPDAVQKDVVAALSKLQMPTGYSWRLAGQNEEQEKAREFLSGAFGVAFLAILFLIVLQFNSLLSPLIIMTSVLLSTIGVLWGLILFQKPFGIIMTGLGVISLAGVAVNNAIVLIDFIEQQRRRGFDRRAAVVRAGTIRMRPVLLTAITTVLGLLPMVFGVSIDFFSGSVTLGGRSAQMWSGMAIAVSFGLIFTTFLTLVLVPVLYDALDDFGVFLLRNAQRVLGTDDDREARAQGASTSAAAVSQPSATGDRTDGGEP